jgi:hypothetical protein
MRRFRKMCSGPKGFEGIVWDLEKVGIKIRH